MTINIISIRDCIKLKNDKNEQFVFVLSLLLGKKELPFTRI